MSMSVAGVIPTSLPSFAPTLLVRHHLSCSLLPRIVASIQRQPSPAAWQIFRKQVSGEWDGFGAEFSSNGRPKELPTAVVPAAFREWEVQLHDWQTQCPTVANESLCYKLIRLLPTVGCEADAATQYSVDERWVQDSNSEGKILAFHVSGSYVALWSGKNIMRENLTISSGSKSNVMEDDKQVSFEIEHCLIQDGQPKFRARVLHQMVMETSMEKHGKSIPVIKSIIIYRENWESEFKNGEVLGGCSTNGSAFATTETLQSSELSGVWHYEFFSTKFEPLHPGIHELMHTDSIIETRKLSENFLPLPQGLWSELIELEDGHFLLTAGWLVKEDAAITSKFEFLSTGEAKKAWMTFERREG